MIALGWQFVALVAIGAAVWTTRQRWTSKQAFKDLWAAVHENDRQTIKQTADLRDRLAHTEKRLDEAGNLSNAICEDLRGALRDLADLRKRLETADLRKLGGVR